jgi:hypothetical protein
MAQLKNYFSVGAWYKKLKTGTETRDSRIIICVCTEYQGGIVFVTYK